MKEIGSVPDNRSRAGEQSKTRDERREAGRGMREMGSNKVIVIKCESVDVKMCYGCPLGQLLNYIKRALTSLL